MIKNKKIERKYLNKYIVLYKVIAITQRDIQIKEKRPWFKVIVDKFNDDPRIPSGAKALIENVEKKDKIESLQTFEYDAVIREMLEWASSAAINDVHFAFGKKELLFKDSLDRFVDSVYTTNNTVLIEDRTETLLTRECGLSNLKATRNDEGAKIFTNDNSAILRMTVHFVQYEQ